MKKDPVIEKLDEILKTLKRIEAKPPSVTYWPYYYYPPYWVQPTTAPYQPQVVWSNPSITVSSGQMSSGGTYNTNGTNAIVPMTLT